MKLAYLGTAMIDLEVGGARFVTDPAMDPLGTTYDFGLWCTPRSWFATEKQYATPPLAPGPIDAVLVSHDHHADNLDFAGRALVADPARVARVVTTPAGAKRLARPRAKVDAPGRGLALGDRATGLAPGSSTTISNVTITAIVARHGPRHAPQVHQVTGFVLDVDGAHGPRIYISGDTVMFPALHATLTDLGRSRPVDVAVIHCGAVGFPRALGFRSSRFTFDASEATLAARLVNARTIVPVHRAGWAHFRQPEADLFAAFDRAGLGAQTRVVPLGDALTL